MSIWVGLGTGLVSSVMVFLGVFTIKQGRDHPESQWFGLFCLAYSAYTVTNTMVDEWFPHCHRVTPAFRLFGEWTAYWCTIFGCLSALFFLNFFDRFLTRFVRRPAWVVGGLQGALLVFLALATFTVYPVGDTPSLAGVPPFFLYYGIALIGSFLYILGMYCVAYPKVGDRKPAFRALGIGIWIFFAGISICDVVLPIMNRYDWLWVGRMCGVLLAISAFVAMTSFRLLDHRTAIHYTVYWVLSLVAGIALLFGTVWVVVDLGWIPPAFSVYAHGVAMAVAGIVVGYVYGIQPRLDAMLFRRRYQLQHEILVFQQRLSALSTVPELVDRLRTLMHRVLAGSSIIVGVPVPNERDWYVDGLGKIDRVSRETIDSWIHDWNSPGVMAWFSHRGATVSHIQPLVVKGEWVGVVVVGEKRNLKPLSSHELVFLDALAPSLAIYIKNAVLYGELRAQGEEMGGLQRQLVALQEGVVDVFQSHTVTSGVLHEVKNTHLAMGGLIQQFLRRRDMDIDLVRDVLAEIGRQSEYLYLFSQNLLYSNPIGAIPFRRDVLPLAPLVSASLKTHDLLLQANQVIPDVSILFEQKIWGDRGRFQLVLSNLIHNAAKYGGRRLGINANQTQSEVVITVVSSQFDAPPRLPILPGVGLRICQRIVSQHQGTLTIDGAVDRVQFVIRLPVG